MRIDIFKIGFQGGALVAPCSAWTQQATTRTVIIQVGDQGGAPIPHAKVPACSPANVDFISFKKVYLLVSAGVGASSKKRRIGIDYGGRRVRRLV